MAAHDALDGEQLAARTARAVDAAVTAARELGLPVREAEVLHDAFSVVVRLRPAPVVARVPVVLPYGTDLSARRARQARELAVVGWLADRGHAVVRPSPLVPREPVLREGFSLSFWEWVEVDSQTERDFVADSRHVPALHAALRAYPGELPFLAQVTSSVPQGLASLAGRPDLLAPADLQRARREWAALEPLLSSRTGFARAFPGVPVQAIHGDAPAYNLLHTSAGIRHADFEDVALGPREWDLAGFGEAGAAAYDAAAELAGLPRLDRAALRVMDTARMLQVVACLTLVPQLPLLATALGSMLEQWRALPFAGGIAER